MTSRARDAHTRSLLFGAPGAWLAPLALLSTLSCNAVVDTSKREPCASNAECTRRFGEPSTCVASSCVKLLTEECTQVLPSGVLEQENSMLFGFMGALRGADASYGTPPKEGAELAFEEIERFINGIPGVDGPAKRHLGMLVCDHGAGDDDNLRVARHLADDVKVPAIIGPSFSGVTLRVFENVARRAGVLVLSPTATSPAITTAEDDGLLWRTAPSDVLQAELLKYLVQDVTNALKKKGVLAERENPRVSLLYKDDAAGRGLQGAVTAKTSGENTAPPVESERQAVYPASAAGTNWRMYYEDILAYEPHIVVPLGTGEFVNNVLKPIEDGWNPNVPRPWYVLPEGSRVEELLTYARDNQSLALEERVIGTAPGARQAALYKAFENSFNGAFDHRKPGNMAEFGYDAAYLLAYAIAITKQQAPDGRALAEALKDVTCGSARFPAGPSGFTGYFTTAARDQCINFDGASGPLDFDETTGEAKSDIAMWCLRKSGSEYSFDPLLSSYYAAEAGEYKLADPPLDLTDPNWCNP